MVFLAAIGLCAIAYYIFYVVSLYFLDTDVSLAFHERFGKPVASLKGKVVWIVGASSGIGENLAYALAKNGCRLILSARREAELQRVKQNCLAEKGTADESDVEILPLDVLEVDKHEAAFAKVLEKYGKLDILVNNAGRSQRAVWENIDLSVDKQAFDLNVFSIVALTRHVVKYFMKQGQGQIVVTSSITGIIGAPNSASYTGSKHALHGYFECLRAEKMLDNISVCMVCPGPIMTDFLQESFTEKTGEKYGKPAPGVKNKLTARRCGDLMAVAIANNLHEVWIAAPAILYLVYLIKYLPNIAKWVLPKLGKNYFQKLRDTKVTVGAAS